MTTLEELERKVKKLEEALLYLSPILNPEVGKAEPKEEYRRTGLLVYANGTNWQPNSDGDGQKGIWFYDNGWWYLHPTKFYNIGTKSVDTVVDWQKGRIQQITLGANIGISFSGGIKSASYILRIIQGTGGNKLITWSGINWGDVGTPVLSTIEGKMDYIPIIYNGTNYNGVGFRKGYV